MSFQPASRLLRYEFRRFKGLSKLALVFVLLIPLLYGGIYLHANWDLYGHLDSIKVAVVNHDKPAEYNGETVAGGEMLEEQLKQESTFDWNFVDTDEVAQDGLAKGEYYMVITVPEDFSSSLVSAGNYKPVRATLTLHRDDANGFIIGSLVGKADDALSKALDNAVSQTYFEALLANVDTIKSQLTAAADGAGQLDDGLVQAAEGVKQLNDGVTQIDTSQLQQQLDAINGGLDAVGNGVSGLTGAAYTIRQGAGDITGVASTIGSGVSSVRLALFPLAYYVNNTLPSLENEAIQIADIDAELTGGADGGLVADTAANLTAAQENLLKLEASTSLSPEDRALVAELKKNISGSLSSHTEVTTKLNTQAQLNASLKVHLDPTVAQALVNAAKAASDTLDTAADQVTSGLSTINDGLDQADTGMADLNGGVSTLRGATSTFMSQAPKLVNGVLQLVNGIGQLNTAMPQLSDGAHTLATGLKDGADRVPSLSESQRDNLSSVMSSPVDINQVVSHDAKYYGRGLAPMFFSIALWVACVSIFLVVRTISGRALTARGGILRTAFMGYGPVAAIMLVSAFIMGCDVWLLLGLDPVHPWLFMFLLALTALSFSALAYWVRLALGSPQTAVFLVALILQLPASGGTFPIAMLGSFYQAIAVISPMRYAIDAFRVVISGGNMTMFWGSCAVLAGIFVVSLGLIYLLVHRRRIFRMRDLHPPMVTSTSTADYAFSVRPR
ncbi:YhgE/Pip domain-containing protein [Arcanobacterium haemolyticum]|nr:YhgE/Pip domain-containing protein [Arcanobacterium haemolyticum]